MRTHSLILMIFAVSTALFSSLHAIDARASLEEGIELRRISEYWKEKEFSTVKVQIGNFLSKYPESSFADQLHAMLGDLYFQEKKYTEAILAFDKIQGQEFRLKSQYHRLHSLYETKQYEEFIDSSALFLNDPNAKKQQIEDIHFELAESYLQTDRPEFLKNALQLFEKLKETSIILERKAYLYTALQEYEKAASCYLLLANKTPDKKEEYLFQTACMQLHFNEKDATKTFAEIVELKGNKVAEAAFNQLCLLFKAKKYEKFILAQEKAIKYISAEQLPLIQYYLGKSLFETHDFQNAIEPLQQSVAKSSETLKKNGLITLTGCAKALGDLSLFENTLKMLKAEFTQEEETEKSLLLFAQLCRDKNAWGKSREAIHDLLRLYPAHQKKETLLYDSALMLLQLGDHSKCAEEFTAFLQEFPASTYAPSALRHILAARLEDMKQATAETKKIKQELLLDSLLFAFEEKKRFSSVEKQKIALLIGKTQFELAYFDEAIESLSGYTKDYPKDSSCADAYLLIAHCHKKSSEDGIHYLLSAEKALALNPQIQEAEELHLSLFNGYLSRAEKVGIEEKGEMIAKAAEHLYLAAEKPISLDNQRWLASYYYQEYERGNQKASERAENVLRKILQREGIKLSTEAETVKLVQILEKAGHSKECIALLEKYKKIQTSHSDLPWKYQRMLTFKLGTSYLSVEKQEKAQQIFSDLISSSSHGSSYYALAAALEKAKLEFSLHKGEESAMMGVFDALKNIQIQRKLYAEPLHLEAALSYVDMKVETIDREERSNTKHFLLERMKENFSAENDPQVEQYLMASAQFPEKLKTYEQYMAYVNAELLRLEAEKNKDPEQLKDAKRQLDQLLADSIDDTLKIRVRKALAL